MANIAWPSNPSVGDTYTFNSITYRWTGTTWSPGTAPISLTGPTGPSGPTGVAGVTGSGWVLISEQTVSNVATVDFTGMDGSYPEYMVIGYDVLPATDSDALLMRISEDNGNTFKSGGTDYTYTYFVTTSGATNASAGGSTTAISMVVGLSNSAVVPSSFSMHVRGVNSSTARKQWMFELAAHLAVAVEARYIGSGEYTTDTNAINAIRFLMNAGNITGKFKLYGLGGSGVTGPTGPVASTGATGAGPTGYIEWNNIIHQWGYNPNNGVTATFPVPFVNTPVVQLTPTGPTGPFSVKSISTTGFLATGIGFSGTGGFFWAADGT